MVQYFCRKDIAKQVLNVIGSCTIDVGELDALATSIIVEDETTWKQAGDDHRGRDVVDSPFGSRVGRENMRWHQHKADTRPRSGHMLRPLSHQLDSVSPLYVVCI